MTSTSTGSTVLSNDGYPDLGLYPYTNTSTITIKMPNSSGSYSNYFSTIASPVMSSSISNIPPIITTNNSGLSVHGDSVFEGDIKIKGRSLEKLLDTIESRLAILQPNPKKLEKFEALKKAYEHYKLLEKLVGED